MLPFERVQKHTCLLQISHVTALGAPAVEWGQQYPRFRFGLPSLPTRFGAHEKRVQREPLSPFLAYLRERLLGLRQPEGHLHGAVQRDGGGQGSASRLPLAGLRVQGAEAPVAVGLEWAHT